MFDLDRAIAEWRRQMLAAGIRTPVPLDELESHLREEFERQVKSGLSEQEIFNSAVQKIGQAHALRLEFKKIAAPLETQFVKLAGIACGVTAGIFSLWILYNLLVIHEVNLAARMLGLLAASSIILSWRYGDKLLPTFHRQWVRVLIGVLCCLASIGGMMLFTTVLPHLLDFPAGADIPVGRLLVSSVWIWAAATIFGVVAYRLGSAAHKNNEQYV
jgi:hypothetical protein